jgi:hypothetical protein
MTAFDTLSFAKAYLTGNEEAQKYDPTKPDFKGAMQIADALGYARNSMEWDAVVGGAAAFYINGHRFQVRASEIIIPLTETPVVIPVSPY